MKPLKVFKLAHSLAPVGGAGSLVKFGQKFSSKSLGNSRRKRLIAIAIITNLVIFLTPKQFLASSIPWSSSQPGLNSSVLSNSIDNSDNLDDSILLPETPSVADESDEDLVPFGFTRIIYLGVFLLITTILLLIGIISKQIARALIGASLLTIVFFVLFFVII